MEGSTIATMYMEALAEHYHFSLDTPIRDLSPELVDILLYGTKGEKIKVHRKSEYGRGTYETEFEGIPYKEDAAGMPYPTATACAHYSCKVEQTLDLGTHLMFVGLAEESEILTEDEPLTYAYYRNVIKGFTPKGAPSYQGNK